MAFNYGMSKSNPESTRRQFLGAATGAALLLADAGAAYGASDFWNKKPASEWSESEVQLLTAKSPWAKPAKAEFGGGRRGRFGTSGDPNDYPGNKTGNFPGNNTGNYPGNSPGNSPGNYPNGGNYPPGTQQRGGIGDPGGGIGNPGGGIGMPGGIGGRRGGQGGNPADSIPIQGIDVTVRWESAKPVLEALKTSLPSEFADHYVIGVNGLSNSVSSAGKDKEDDMLDRLKGSAFLQAKGKEAIQPGVVQRSKDGSEVLFGFKKEFLPLSASDKDVQFSLNTGQISVKAKFDPKEMVYRGKFEA
jgi:hypothetical protein